MKYTYGKKLKSFQQKLTSSIASLVLLANSFGVAVPFILTQKVAAADTLLYSEGFVSGTGNFETGAGDYGSITNAGGHAVVDEVTGAVGPYTWFDQHPGTDSTWTHDYQTSIDVYLDTNWADGSGFEWDVASASTTSSHRRDFIAHVVKDISTSQLLFSASNNSNYSPKQNSESGDHYVITTSGWYKIQHSFRNNAGVLAVDISLADASGNTLYTITRSTASDTIPGTVGAHGYGWFTDVTIPGGLQIDNVSLVSQVPDPEITNIKAELVPNLTNATSYPYTGISVNPTFENITDATEFQIIVHREDGSTVTKTSKPGASFIDSINNGTTNTTTAPIIIEDGSYGEDDSSSWFPARSVWTSTTKPTSVEVKVLKGSDVIASASTSTFVGPGTVGDLIPGPVYRTDPGSDTAEEYFDTIQEAIDDNDGMVGGNSDDAAVGDGSTDDGDTIVVTAGEYNGGRIDVDKSITIKGVGDATQINRMLRMRPGAVDVTLADFKVTNTSGNAVDVESSTSMNSLTIDTLNMNSSKHTVGAGVEGSTPTIGTLTIKDSVATSPYPVYVDHAVSNIVITDNVLNTVNGNRGIVFSKQPASNSVNISANFFVMGAGADANTMNFVKYEPVNPALLSDIMNNNYFNDVTTGSVAVKISDDDKAIVVDVDTTRPTISVHGSSPDEGDHLSGVRWTREGQPDQQRNRFIFKVEDESGIKKVAMYIFDKDENKVDEYALIQHNTHGEQWYADVDTTQYPDGLYHISARAVDNANNVKYFNNRLEGYHVYMDNTAPKITVKDGFVGDKDAKVFSKVSFKLFDAMMADKYTINGGTATDFTDNKWSDANFGNIKSRLVEGENTITLYDAAGNSTSYTFIYDNTSPDAPVVSLNETPSGDIIMNGGLTNSYGVVASWSVGTDDAGYEYRYYNSITGDTYNAPNYYVTQPTVNSTNGVFNRGEGLHHIQVRTVDFAGNWSGWSPVFDVTYDATAPEVSGVVLNGETVNVARSVNCGPTEFNLVSGKIDLSATITDNISGVKNARYKIRKVTNGGCTQAGIYQSGTVNMNNPAGNSWVTLTGSELDTAVVPADGNYTIMMTITDNAGNSTTQYVDITVDNTAPVVTVNGISAIVEGNDAVVTGSVDDPSVTTVEIFVDGISEGAATVTGGSFSFNVTGLALGTHSINVRAADDAGNVGQGTESVVVGAALPAFTGNPGGQGGGDDGDETGDNTGDGNVVITDNNEEEGVLAEETDEPNTAETFQTTSGDVAGTSDEGETTEDNSCTKWLGICWYWWIPIVAVILGTIYYISRRNADEK